MIKRFTWFSSLVDNGGDVPSGTSTRASIKTLQSSSRASQGFPGRRVAEEIADLKNFIDIVSSARLTFHLAIVNRFIWLLD
jgi:hypothetical protein